MFAFRFQHKETPSLEQFLEKLEYEIIESQLNGIYGLCEIDDGPEENKCTTFPSVFIKEKIRLFNNQ